MRALQAGLASFTLRSKTTSASYMEPSPAMFRNISGPPGATICPRSGAPEIYGPISKRAAPKWEALSAANDAGAGREELTRAGRSLWRLKIRRPIIYSGGSADAFSLVIPFHERPCAEYLDACPSPLLRIARLPLSR
jgi:hypothetical protein